MIGAFRARFDALRGGYLQRPFTSVQLLLLSGGMLLALGVLMATSTTISASLHEGTQGTEWTQVTDEITFVLLGVPICWLGARMPPRGFRLLAYPLLIVALTLLAAVLVPHIGVQLNGASRWFRVGPIQVQPSEFAKLAMLVWGADLLARKLELGTLTRARHVMVPLVPGFVVIGFLVMLEPDLGTTLCFITILVGLLWTVGLPFRYFLGLLVGLGAAVTLLAVAEPYRLQRLTSFTDPFKDANGAGHQAVQGLYALSSGGIFGVGLGSGALKYGWVPNANTDYVFAIVGEELGLLGCLAVLSCFGLFAYTALRIARRSDDSFVRLAASGAAVWICGQALINVGYVTGLLPVTGIPLPFVSAGGTSLVLTMGVFGMLLSFARHEPDAVAAARLAAESGQRSRLVRVLNLGVPKPAKPRPQRPPKVRSEPKGRRPAPAVPTSARREPVRREPVRREPVRREPVRREPVRREPVRREPVRREPVRREPVRREPVRREPVRREPVRRDPVRGEPPPVRRSVARERPLLRPTGTDPGR